MNVRAPTRASLGVQTLSGSITPVSAPMRPSATLWGMNPAQEGTVPAAPRGASRAWVWHAGVPASSRPPHGIQAGPACSDWAPLHQHVQAVGCKARPGAASWGSIQGLPCGVQCLKGFCTPGSGHPCTRPAGHKAQQWPTLWSKQPLGRKPCWGAHCLCCQWQGSLHAGQGGTP